MKPYFFHPAAEEEYIAAAEHYRNVDPALAVAFFEEVESVIAHIRRFPAAGVESDVDIRRSLLSRFPYGVLYEEKPRPHLDSCRHALAPSAELLGASRGEVMIPMARADPTVGSRRAGLRFTQRRAGGGETRSRNRQILDG